MNTPMPPDRRVRYVIRPLQGHAWVLITCSGKLFCYGRHLIL
jgi:hypothetical protein